ncbi:hypothetical protein D3C86_1214070 [compost metagenome]
MRLVQLVQQGALQLEAGGAGVLLVQVGLQQLFQLVQRLQADAGGELVVDLGFGLGLDGLDRDVEGGGFAGQVLGLVFFREGDLDGLLFADLGALELLFEARDEAVGADHQVGVLGRTAFEHFTVQLADEVDGQLVAFGGLDGLALLVLVGLGLRGQFLQGFVQIFVRSGVGRTLQLQGLGVDRGEVGHDFQRHFVGQVFLTGDDLVHVRDQLHLGRGGRTQLGVVQGLLAGFVQRGVDDFAHEVTAEGLLDVRGRHLARTEALELHLGRNFLDARFQLFVQLGYRDGHREHAAEAFVRLFDDLHGRDSDALWRRRTARAVDKAIGPPFWSGASKPALMSRRGRKVNAPGSLVALLPLSERP